MPDVRRLAKVGMAVLVALPLLVVGATATAVTTATAASASSAPITLAYITDLTGEGALPKWDIAGRVQGPDRPPERGGRRQRAQARSL